MQANQSVNHCHREKNEKIMKRTEEDLRDIQKKIKHTNICIFRIPEGEDKQKEPENIIRDYS